VNSTLIPARLGELATLEHAVSSSLIDWPRPERACSGLDEKTNALLRLAAVVAVGSSGRCHGLFVRRALDAGAAVEEVLGTMTTIAPILGLGRLVAATPKIALGLGYDIDAALEGLGGS
jgi:alkylhydroperoxidase/carboxymuconolactone decarboxylase family protein YurZ